MFPSNLKHESMRLSCLHFDAPWKARDDCARYWPFHGDGRFSFNRIRMTGWRCHRSKGRVHWSSRRRRYVRSSTPEERRLSDGRRALLTRPVGTGDNTRPELGQLQRKG